MDTLEKKVSFLVQNQFPEFYQTYGIGFIEFVKEYYTWLESNGQVINKIYNTVCGLLIIL